MYKEVLDLSDYFLWTNTGYSRGKLVIFSGGRLYKVEYEKQKGKLRFRKYDSVFFFGFGFFGLVLILVNKPGMHSWYWNLPWRDAWYRNKTYWGAEIFSNIYAMTACGLNLLSVYVWVCYEEGKL